MGYLANELHLTTRVVLADHHVLVRDALSRVFERNANTSVVGIASSGEETLRVVEDVRPHVVILDVTLPGLAFSDVIARLRGRHPNVAVLVVTGAREDDYAVRAFEAGAHGFLTTQYGIDELMDALNVVSNGRRYVTSTVAEQLLGHANGAPHHRLSGREYTVLLLLGAGLSQKQIAARLDVSPKTVSTYRSRILSKLQLATNADLVRYTIVHQLEPERG